MSLGLAVKIFETYVLPIFTYCAPVYASNLKSQNAIQQLNAVFTNYLKRYLGLPKYAQNSAVHYYCGTWPLHYAIMNIASRSVHKLNFPPDSLNGHQISFSNVPLLPPFVPVSEMDPDFPTEKLHISRNRVYRKKKFCEIFNVHHYKICTIEKFHINVTKKCKCIYCKTILTRGHVCPEK